MRKVVDAVMKFVSVLIGILLFIAVLLVLAQVIWRYVLKAPLGWTDQLCRFFYVWIVMLGLPVLFHEKGVTAFDYLSGKMKPKQQAVLHVIVSLLSIAFSICFFYFSILFIQRKGNQMIPAFRTIPYVTIYASMPVSAVLLFVEMVLQFFESIKQVGKESN